MEEITTERTKVIMHSVRKIHKALENAIDLVVTNKEMYVKNPGKDFTRNRKFTMKDVINQIISMDGGSLKKELYDFSKVKGTALTPSAFIQQRSKISSMAFKDILYKFNEQCNDIKTFRGYQLLAVDGTDINCYRNPESPNFYFNNQYAKGCNLIHANALYDLRNRTYIDVYLQPRKQGNERKALVHMLQKNKIQNKSIITADRGYESYNMFAHFINTENVDFVCRAKNGHGAMSVIKNLPMEESDVDITLEITTTQTNEDKVRGRTFIQTGSKKGKKNSSKTALSTWDFPSPYILKFRVVRFKLNTGEYETIVTSLNRKKFSINEIKELYNMRWGIETSFRELKYIIGLTHLHCKKDSFIEQEIYAALILYNYCSRIANSVIIKKHSKCRYAYKIDFTMAVYICKKFYNAIQKDFITLVSDICSYTEPVRPGRHDVRNIKFKNFIGFTYRVAA